MYGYTSFGKIYSQTNRRDTMKKLQEIMTQDIVTVTAEDNIFEIALKMRDHDIGFIPVVEGNKLIGVVTDRDLVLRGYADKRSGSGAVEEVMTNKPITATPDTTVDEAAHIMAEKQIRRLPIVKNGELVGVVAIGDLAVNQSSEEEAGQALSDISVPTKQMAGANK
jgi:CBS domain-containing protein